MRLHHLLFIFLFIFTFIGLSACNFDAKPTSHLSISLNPQPLSIITQGTLPSTPALPDFWRGAIMVSGSDFDRFQVNFSVENQRVLARDVEFEIPAGTTRKVEVVLVSDGSTQTTDSPFDIANASPKVYVYKGSATFSATEPEVTVTVELSLETYEQSFDFDAELTGDNSLVEVHVFIPPISSKEDQIGALSSPDLFDAMLFGAVTATAAAGYASMRLPYNVAFALSAIPSKSAAYTHSLLENWVINIPTGQGIAPTQQKILENFVAKNIAKTLIHLPGKNPTTIAPYQYASSKSGQQIFINPTATNTHWLETTDFDGDGFGLLAELNGNSDPFDSNSVPGALIASAGGVDWLAIQTLDAPKTQYHDLKLSFAENGEEFGMIGFRRGARSTTHQQEPQTGEPMYPDVSLYTLPVLTVPNTVNKVGTGTLSFGTLTKSISDAEPMSATFGDLSSFDLCMASSSFGILVANNRHKYFISPPYGEHIFSVQSLTLSNRAFTGSTQFLVDSTESSLNNFAFDVDALCDSAGTGGVIGFTFSEGGSQQPNTLIPWRLRVAQYNAANRSFAILPDTAALVLRSNANASTTFPTKPFSTSFLDETTAYLGLAQIASPPKVVGVTTKGTTLQGFTEKTSRTGFEIGQFHTRPLGQVISGAYKQGILNVYVEKSLTNQSDTQNQLQYQFFDGTDFNIATPISTAGGTDSAITILDVASHIDTTTKQAGSLAIVLYKKQLLHLNELHVATLEYTSDGRIAIKEDVVIGAQQSQADGSFSIARAAFFNKVQAVVVYPQSVSGQQNQYQYWSLTYDNGVKDKDLITTTPTTTTLTADLLIDISMVRGDKEKILTVFTLCSTEKQCVLTAAAGGIRPPPEPAPQPRKTSLFERWR